MVNASPLPGVDDGGSSPTSCSAGIYSSFGSANSQTESLRIGAAARPQHAEFGLRPTYQHSERTHLPTLIEERLRNLLGEPLSDADRASVRLAPLRSCLTGEIVAVQDSDGVLRYGKVKDEEAAGEVKVQVSKACIRWCAVSQIYFFQAVNRARQSSKEVDVWTGNKEEEGESSTVSVIAEVNALLARLNVSLSTSYEELLAELLRLQHRAVLAEEDRRVALKQKRDAERALVCVVCLVNAVDRVLIPCGHSYCSDCVKRLHRESCPVCRQEVSDSAAFRIS